MSDYALGVDIGGTKIAVGAIDANGVVQARRTIPTNVEAGFAAGLVRLSQAIDETLADAGTASGTLVGIGIGCAGPVDPENGRIENDYTLPGWEGNDIVTPLASRYDTPVRIANDADAALLGEALAGAARGVRVAVMLTIGTGVGGAALIGGKLLRGAAGAHPEIGHMPVDPSGPACYCGTRGCLEVLTAGPAIARAGAEFGYPDTESVFAAAEAGAAPARAILARSADAIETATSSLIHTFLPEVIIFGGGIGERHYPLYRDAAERAIARAKFAPDGAVHVARAALGNDAGMVGAAALVLERG